MFHTEGMEAHGLCAWLNGIKIFKLAKRVQVGRTLNGMVNDNVGLVVENGRNQVSILMLASPNTIIGTFSTTPKRLRSARYSLSQPLPSD